ncbi:hypothetical protein Tco_0966578 [Tanacetum coccineum]
MVNGERQLQALVDRKKIVITESIIRRDLHLEDAEGTECLPTATIFDEIIDTLSIQEIIFVNQQLGDMSHHEKIFVTPSHTKKVFGNMRREGKGFSVRKQSRRKQRRDNEVLQPSGPIEPIADEAPNEEHVPTHSNDLLLSEITELKERVKKLKKKGGSRTHKLKRLYKVGRSARVVSFEDKGLGDQKDASKQGKKIDEIDQDAEVTLVDETHGRYSDNLMFDIGVLDNEEVFVGQDMAEKEVDMAEKDVSTANPVTTAGEVVTTASVEIPDELTLAQSLIEIKSVKPKAVTTAATTVTPVSTRPKGKGIVFHDQEEQAPISTPIVSSSQLSR